MSDFRFVTIGSRPTLSPEELMSLVNPTGAQDYFVDLNRSVAGDGLTWDTAFKTLADAIAASNASIGLAANRWWARRNRIFVQGDILTEDLTVLPEKTDIIGVGTDLRPFPRVFGNHVIVLNKVGVRFINMGFNAVTTGDLFSIPASSHGLQFINCYFQPNSTCTKALEITDCAHVRIEGCRFDFGAGDKTKVFGECIAIEGTVMHDIVIKGNQICGTLGIVIANGTGNGGMIVDNYLRCIGIPITDASDDFAVINNRWITDVDCATYTAGFDLNLLLACGNLQTGSNAGNCNMVPPLALTDA